MKKNKKSEVATLRMTKDEKNMLIKEANDNGFSLCSWLRIKMLNLSYGAEYKKCYSNGKGSTVYYTPVFHGKVIEKENTE
jgi:hypothetical protein